MKTSKFVSRCLQAGCELLDAQPWLMPGILVMCGSGACLWGSFHTQSPVLLYLLLGCSIPLVSLCATLVVGVPVGICIWLGLHVSRFLSRTLGDLGAWLARRGEEPPPLNTLNVPYCSFCGAAGGVVDGLASFDCGSRQRVYGGHPVMKQSHGCRDKVEGMRVPGSASASLCRQSPDGAARVRKLMDFLRAYRPDIADSIAQGVTQETIEAGVLWNRDIPASDPGTALLLMFCFGQTQHADYWWEVAAELQRDYPEWPAEKQEVVDSGQ